MQCRQQVSGGSGEEADGSGQQRQHLLVRKAQPGVGVLGQEDTLVVLNSGTGNLVLQDQDAALASAGLRCQTFGPSRSSITARRGCGAWVMSAVTLSANICPSA